jgi:hypothetical protein
MPHMHSSPQSADCALCLQAKPLRQSHILAECCYRNTYADDNRSVAVRLDDGRITSWKAQSGVWEPLLCDACEQLLNKHETYFARVWLDHNPLPFPLASDAVAELHVEYAPFKLFHLANLWRAGATSRQAFEHVDLGRHKERLRRMLLAGDPGRPSEYPLLGFCVINPNGSLHNRIVSPFQSLRVDGHTVYSVIHSGAEWLIRTSNHAAPELDRCALTASGVLGLAVVPWNEHSTLTGLARAYSMAKKGKRT